MDWWNGLSGQAKDFCDLASSGDESFRQELESEAQKLETQ